VDVFTVDALPGDLFLLCSDGLTDMLSADEIEHVIAEVDAAPKPAAEALVAAANARGGEDNITVVLFELLADDDPQAEAQAEVTVDAQAASDVTPSATSIEAGGGDEPAAAASDPSLSRHGAGAGGRLAALLLIAAVLAVAVLVVLWSLSR
jgi:protein phosphatase